MTLFYEAFFNRDYNNISNVEFKLNINWLYNWDFSDDNI